MGEKSQKSLKPTEHIRPPSGRRAGLFWVVIFLLAGGWLERGASSPETPSAALPPEVASLPAPNVSRVETVQVVYLRPAGQGRPPQAPDEQTQDTPISRQAKSEARKVDAPPMLEKTLPSVPPPSVLPPSVLRSSPMPSPAPSPQSVPPAQEVPASVAERVPAPPLPPPRPPEALSPPALPREEVRTPVAVKGGALPDRTPSHPKAEPGADMSEVAGVKLRVFLPGEVGELESMLRNSGGCLLVSRMKGKFAEAVAAFELVQGQLRERAPRSCRGIPRVVGASMNATLGDPLGRVRERYLDRGETAPPLLLQVLAPISLPQIAERTLALRYGKISPEDMAARAKAEGYSLRCFTGGEARVWCE